MKHTERRTILDVLDKNGNRLYDLDFNFVASVLLDNTNNIVQHILL